MSSEVINVHLWLKGARPGQEIEYYRGFLMNDRKGHPKLSFYADMALRSQEEGRVILFQRKIRCSVYSYVALRTKKK